jgi:hypothetical protein
MENNYPYCSAIVGVVLDWLQSTGSESDNWKYMDDIRFRNTYCCHHWTANAWFNALYVSRRLGIGMAAWPGRRPGAVARMGSAGAIMRPAMATIQAWYGLSIAIDTLLFALL